MEIPGYDNKAALQQVNQFWSMLDDMSQNNPEEYRTFIERQLREGEEFHSPPQPHACIRTALLVNYTFNLHQESVMAYFLEPNKQKYHYSCVRAV